MKNAENFSLYLYLGAAAFLFVTLFLIVLFSVRRKRGTSLREEPAVLPVSRPVAPRACVLPRRETCGPQPAKPQPGTSAFWTNSRSRRGPFR